jgi:hypothetical protein
MTFPALPLTKWSAQLTQDIGNAIAASANVSTASVQLADVRPLPAAEAKAEAKAPAPAPAAEAKAPAPAPAAEAKAPAPAPAAEAKAPAPAPAPAPAAGGRKLLQTPAAAPAPAPAPAPVPAPAPAAEAKPAAPAAEAPAAPAPFALPPAPPVAAGGGVQAVYFVSSPEPETVNARLMAAAADGSFAKSLAAYGVPFQPAVALKTFYGCEALFSKGGAGAWTTLTSGGSESVSTSRGRGLLALAALNPARCAHRHSSAPVPPLRPPPPPQPPRRAPCSRCGRSRRCSSASPSLLR